jgi:mutator protein MutT
MGGPRPTKVVAGIVVESGRVLLAQRAPGQLFAGQWEFPGGKVEPGESHEAALDREFREELGIQVSPIREYGRIAYRNRLGMDVTVTFYLARRTSGEPRPHEVQAVDWVEADRLATVDMIPFNREIVERLGQDLEAGRI